MKILKLNILLTLMLAVAAWAPVHAAGYQYALICRVGDRLRLYVCCEDRAAVERAKKEHDRDCRLAGGGPGFVEVWSYDMYRQRKDEIKPHF